MAVLHLSIGGIVPTFIIKLEDKGEEWYLFYSTIVDSPTTFGMPLEELRETYRDRFGSDAMRDLPARLARVEEKGTSALDDDSADSTLLYNRAGYEECELTKAEIIEWYCRKRQDPPEEAGFLRHDGEDDKWGYYGDKPPCKHLVRLRQYLADEELEIWGEHTEPDQWVNISCERCSKTYETRLRNYGVDFEE
jgi:hypothetical protein